MEVEPPTTGGDQHTRYRRDGPRHDLLDPQCQHLAYPRYNRGLSFEGLSGDLDLVFPPHNQDIVEGPRTFLEVLVRHAVHFL